MSGFKVTVPIEVEFQYYPATPDTRYEPGTPDEVEIDYIRIDGEDITTDVSEAMIDMLTEHLEDTWTDWYDGAYDE